MANQSKKIAVILLGLPGCGKDTQAGLLAEKFGLFHVESSKLIREKLNSLPATKEEEAEISREKAIYASGELNTPSFVTKLINEKIKEKGESGRGIVFSGSPRTPYEREQEMPVLEEIYGNENIFIFYLKINPELTFWRLTHRRICEKCAAPVPFLPETENLKTCAKCGGKLVPRKLDKPEVIAVRLKDYERLTKPVIEYFENENSLIEIHGDQPIQNVFEDVVSYIERI